MKKVLMILIVGLFLVGVVNAQTDETSCETDNDCSEEKTCSDGSTYHEIGCYNNVCEQMVFAGGSPCGLVAKHLTQSQIQKIIKSQNRLNIQAQIGECPTNCTCTGSVTKCQINGGREMTVTAGKSGNTIVQVKGVNMSTNVTLYKANGSVYGTFKNNETKIVKVLPDGVKEKIRQRIRARLENHNITLDEDGVYQIQAKKRARLFYLFPVREKVKVQISSETGDIIKIRNPWWGFLARDVKEDIVGGCGTVTPGLENECCQNLGYDSWNSESLECE